MSNTMIYLCLELIISRIVWYESSSTPTLSWSLDWETPVLKGQQTISTACFIHSAAACQDLEPGLWLWLDSQSSGCTVSCWAGEDGEEKEVGFMLTQAAVNNSNVVPIPMLWRTGAAGGGFPTTPVGCSSVKWFVGGSLGVVRREEGGRIGVCVCVFGGGWRVT